MTTSRKNPRAPENPAAEVKSSLRIYLGCLAGLWAIGLIVVAVQSTVLHRNYYPFNTLLFAQKHRFTDFTIFYPRLSVFGNAQAFFSPTGIMFTYPAPLLLICVGLWRISHSPLAVYVGSVLIFAGMTGIVAFRTINRRGGANRLAAATALAAGAFSFPIFFLLDRANLEGFVWMAGAVGLYSFAKRRYYLAAGFLALAASMKIFPAVLLLLFLAKRRYKEFFISAASIVAITVFSLWVTGPSIIEAARGLATGIDRVRNVQVVMFEPPEIGFDHCLFSFLKWIALLSEPDRPSYEALIRKLLPFYALCAVLGFLTLYSIKLRRMPVLNQVVALTALSVMLPYSSFEYTLVHLILPFILVLVFLANDVALGAVPLEKKQILRLIIPFALLFAPMSYLILFVAGFAGQIKAIALIYLVHFCLRVPLPSSLFGELGEDSRNAKVHAEIDQSGVSSVAIRV